MPLIRNGFEMSIPSSQSLARHSTLEPFPRSEAILEVGRARLADKIQKAKFVAAAGDVPGEDVLSFSDQR